MTSEHQRIGIIGVGEMGGPVAVNLRQAGFPVAAYDLDPERLAAVAEAGVGSRSSADEIVQSSSVVLTSLPSSDAFVQVATNSLVPRAQPDQIFIDLGTVIPHECRRIGQLLAAKGAHLLDVPVSGGPGGAERADLYLFVGGEPDIVERVRPMLQAIGAPERTTYCGPTGSGQVVKGVNQLMMGLGAAAYLEAVAFGVRAGVPADVIERAIGNTGFQREDFNRIAKRVVAGDGVNVGVKFRELPYFLAEARHRGFSLPLTDALRTFCDRGERIVIDDHRLHPSFWHELDTQTCPEAGEQPAD